MSALRKIKRVGKKASKFQYTATYQSVVVECQRVETWKPHLICVSWSRRGRRFFTHRRPWQASLDNPTRGVVIWPDKEIMETTVTLYKSPKDTSYETKEWEFHVIDVDNSGKRKILGSTAINMVRYASTMPFDHDVQLQLKPVSRKIKRVILDITLCSLLLKEGKATDDDMLSIASMMSVSNLSMIGNLEDDDDDSFAWHGGRSITPPPMLDSILSPEELLKWTQEVTAGYRGVKVTNMTTSWRTGMGFLAIIHYYRPDLIDIEAVSPNAIKENNKLAFELAHVLGISCPLTPSAMISATIPDKLLVSSFLFNMHQYFTRALPSAIAKDSTQNGSAPQSPTSEDKSSPFDISKIHKVFDDPNIYNNLSPVSSPSHSGEVNRYSRHSSRRNSEEQEGGGRNIRVSGDHGVKTHSSSSSLVLVNRNDGSGADPGQGRGNPEQGGSNPGQGGSNPGQGGSNLGQGDGNLGQGGGKLGVADGANQSDAALDQLVMASANTSQREMIPSITVSAGGPDEGGGGEGGREEEVVRESTEEDRLLEFEGESESEPRTSSSVSLDQSQNETTLQAVAQPPDSVAEEDNSAPAVDTPQEERGGEGEGGGGKEKLEESGQPGREEEEKVEGQRRQLEGVRQGEEVPVDEFGRRNSEGAGSKPHRRLPTVPTGSPEITTKDEERRQMAKELLRRHKIRPGSADFLSSSSSGKRKSLDSKQEKYREQVRKMLGEIQSNSPSSSSRLPRPSADEENELAADLSSTSLPEILEKEEQTEPPVSIKTKEEEDTTEKARETPPSSESSEIVSYESEPKAHRPSNDSIKRKVGVVNRPQVVVVEGGASSTSLTATANTKPLSSTENGEKGRGQPDKAPPTSQPRTRHKKPPVQELQIKPVQSKPSAAAQQLLESKKQQQKSSGEGGGGGGGSGVDTDGSGGKPAEQEEGEKEEEEEEEETQNGDTEERKTTGGSKLESPSPWDEHNEGLEMDILLTRNEYVRCELSRLQQQLQNMERRAVEIETDVRHAMSTGNKEDEESMMQEWFSLLNGKNELIKRQIELNLVEKEEDLEKKQFFINRELRPLMEIPDEQKTPQQKARVDILVQDLLGIVDERDKVERKKMSIASKSTHRERDGFASDDSGLPPNKQANASMDRTGSKDCVIS